MESVQLASDELADVVIAGMFDITGKVQPPMIHRASASVLGPRCSNHPSIP